MGSIGSLWGRSWDHHSVTCSSASETIFSNAVFKRLLEKKIAVPWRSDPSSLFSIQTASFLLAKSLTRCWETTVLPRNSSLIWRCLSWMMGRDGLRFADEGEANLFTLFAIAEEQQWDLVWNLSFSERNSCRPIVSPKRMKQSWLRVSQEQPRMSYSRRGRNHSERS